MKKSGYQKRILAVLLSAAVLYTSVTPAYAEEIQVPEQEIQEEPEQEVQTKSEVQEEPEIQEEPEQEVQAGSEVQEEPEIQEEPEQEVQAESQVQEEQEVQAESEVPVEPEAPAEPVVVHSLSELMEFYGQETDLGTAITIPADETVYLAETLELEEGTWIFGGGGTLMRDTSCKDALISIQGGTVTLNDITLDGNKENVSANGSLIRMADSSGELNICDGAFLQNNDNTSESEGKAGGAVCIYTTDNSEAESTLHMSGGTIQNNTSARFGGAIFCYAPAVIEIDGGTICNNIVVSESGTGYGGGGIYLKPISEKMPVKFSMTGGLIKDNQAKHGAGIEINANTAGSSFSFGGTAKISDICYLTGLHSAITFNSPLQEAVQLELADNLKKESQVVVYGSEGCPAILPFTSAVFTNLPEESGLYVRSSKENNLYISEISPDKYRGVIQIMAGGEDVSKEVEFEITDSQGEQIPHLSYSEYVFAFKPGEAYTCTTGAAVGYRATTQEFTVQEDEAVYEIDMQQGTSVTVTSLSQLITYYGTVDEGKKTVTISIPQGTIVNIGATISLNEKGYTYVLTGGGTLKRSTANRRILFDVYNETVLQLDDMVIDGNRSKIRSYGGVVWVNSGGRFIMNGGVIQNNYASSNVLVGLNAGTVHIAGSKLEEEFVMNGGIIRNNYCTYGGAVGLSSGYTAETSAEFTMNGGQITGNTSIDGGAVYINNGFMQQADEETGQPAKYYRNVFCMNGGEITDNYAAQDGGAVYCIKSFQVSLNQGTISGNIADRYGNGVFNASEEYGDSIRLGGGICISDEIHLRILGYASEYLTLTEPLAYDVYLETTNAASTLYEGNKIAQGTSSYSVTEADAEKIHIVNEGYEAEANMSGNALLLKLKEYTITFLNASGKVISSKVYKHNQKITVPTATKAKDATYVYVFYGWSDGELVYTVIPKAKRDVEYTAVFTPYTYDAYFEYLAADIVRVSYTDAIRQQLNAAEKAYEELNDEQKSKESVQKAYEKLQDQKAVFDAIFKIKSIGTVTIGSTNAIAAARNAYDALTARGKEMLPEKYLVMLLDAEREFRLLTRGQKINVPYATYNISYGSAPFSLGASATGDSVLTYSSSNSDVAAVSSKGVVSVMGVGNAVITITAPETEKYDEAQKKVTVKVRRGYQTITTNVSWKQDSFVLNASSSGDGKILYTSADMSLATVNKNGVVSLTGLGTVKITIQAVATLKYYMASKEVVFDVTAKKGKTYTVDSIQYYVTNDATDGSGTVTVTGTTNASLSSLDIGNTVKLGNHTYKITAINDSAFKDKKALNNVKIGTNVKTIGKSAFYGCSALASVSGGSELVTVDNYAFYGCAALTSLPAFTKVTYLGSSALRGCKSLKSFALPSSVSQIGAYTFYGCSALTAISGGSGIASIGDYSFYGCAALASFPVMDQAAYIGNNAFRGCKSLKSFSIGSSVKQIGNKAFYGCGNLKSISVRGTKLKSVGAKALKGIYKKAVIKVPSSKFTAYKKLLRGKGQGAKVKIKKG